MFLEPAQGAGKSIFGSFAAVAVPLIAIEPMTGPLIYLEVVYLAMFFQLCFHFAHIVRAGVLVFFSEIAHYWDADT